MNEQSKKILLINFLILLTYSIGFSFLDDGSTYGELIPMIFKAYAVGIQSIICLIVAIVKYVQKERILGNTWLLTSLIMGTVGFSFCTIPVLMS